MFDAKVQQQSNPNPALDFGALNILRLVKQLNNEDKNLPQLVNAAHRVLHDRFVDTYRQGEQYLLSLSQREVIYEHYRKSNLELNKKYFSGRDSLFPELESSEIMFSTESVNIDAVHAIYHEAGIPFPELRMEEISL